LIAFGLAITEDEPFRRFAEPGLRRAAEADSQAYKFAAVWPIGRTYNLILDAAAQREDLEALVLLDPYAEIDDQDFCHAVRRAMSDPDVAVAGCVGGKGVTSLAWWRGEAVISQVVHNYHDEGGGKLPGFSWAQPASGGGEVDCVDGLVLVLSPWAVHNLRFDESLIHGYGFDMDFCLQARAAGRKVVVADLRMVDHRGIELIGNLGLWTEAHKQLAAKWDGRWPGAQADERLWKERARRAEAEREAARAFAVSRELAADARERTLEAALEAATGSLSWRLTAGLRRLNQLRRR
jgi:Glycosyltransferase like family